MAWRSREPVTMLGKTHPLPHTLRREREKRVDGDRMRAEGLDGTLSGVCRKRTS